MRVIRILLSLVLAASVPFAFAAPAAAEVTSRPQIAITFDDAPTYETPTLLGILGERDAVATFFMVGMSVEEFPDEARAVADAGMLVGNHSYDHTHTADLDVDALRENLTQAQDAIRAGTGVTPRWYRPPFFDSNPLYYGLLPELGLKPSWSNIINTKDWDGREPEQILDLVMEQKFPGGVVVMHDMTDDDNTIRALPVLIDELRAAGYVLVTLDDSGLGGIEGTVTAGSGASLSGASVTAYDALGAAVATATTSAGGHYRVGELDPGDYTLGFGASGYLPRYFDAATSEADAREITVTEDHTSSGADMILYQPDSTPPTTTVTPALDGWFNHDVTVDFSVEDTGPPGEFVTTCRLDPPGGEPVRFTGPVTVTREGVTELAYRSTDPSGNAEATRTALVRIDRTAPVTGFSLSRTADGAAVIGLSATDTASGVAETRYRIDDAAESEGTAFTVDELGGHVVHYHSIDAAGNVEAEGSSAFSVIARTVLAIGSSAGYTVWPGSAVTVNARLSRDAAGGPALAGRRVSIQASPNGVGGWSTVGEGTTSSTGEVSMTVRPLGTTYYRAVHGGVPDTLEATESAAVTVRVPLVSRLSSTVSARTPSYKKTVTISGTLRRATGTAVGGATVRLQTLRSGVWTNLATARTSGSGSVSFPVTPSSKTAYRLRFEGTPGTDTAATGSVLTVTPKAFVGTPKARSVMKRGKRHTVRGSLRPGHTPGAKAVRVYRWRKVDGRWKRAGYVTATVSASGKGYTAKIRLTKRGKWRLRAYAPADAGHAAAWSKGYDYVSVR